MEFVENKGQWNNNVQFKGDFSAGSFFLEQKGLTVLLHNSADLKAVSELGHAEITGPVTLHSFAYKVKFLRRFNQGESPIGTRQTFQPTYNNYFIGNDPAAWARRL